MFVTTRRGLTRRRRPSRVPIVRALRVTPGQAARPRRPRPRRPAGPRREGRGTTACSKRSRVRLDDAAQPSLGGGEPQRRARAPGDGRVRQGRHDPSGPQRPEPAGLRGRQLQGADHARARARLPLARARRAAGPRDPRRDEPVALRGRRHRARHRARSTTTSGRAGSGTSASSSACSTDEGTTVVKVFLHISKEEQRARLQERIDNPEKNWKFRRADLEVRAKWDEYQERYERGDHRDLDAVGAVVRGARRSQVGPRHRRRHDPRRRVRAASIPGFPIPNRVSRAFDRRVSRRRFGRSTGPRGGPSTRMGYSMDVESRDSVSLKPAELDELGQLASDAWACRCRTSSSTVTSSSSRWSPSRSIEGELHGFLFGSLERIGGTPVHPVGPRGDPPGPPGAAEPRRARRRAVPAGGDLVPRRGRARRGPGRAPGGVLAARRAHRRVPAAEVHAQRRGAGVGPAARPPLRLRRPLRRPHVPPLGARRRPSSCSTPAR